MPPQSFAATLARRMSVAFILLLVTGLVFWPGLHGGFVFDDWTNIAGNTALHLDRLSWGGLRHAAFSLGDGFPRPLAFVSFALNYAVTGPEPFGFKATNLLLHIGNGFLLTVLLRQWQAAMRQLALPGALPALAGAALVLAWMVHPLHSSTVLYAVQRMELLGATFTLLALCAYCAGRNRQFAGHTGWPWLAASAAIALMGLTAKETSLLAAPLALSLEWSVFRWRAANPQNQARFRLFVGACTGLAAVLVVFVIWGSDVVDYSRRDYGMGERLLSQGRVLSTHLGLALLPTPSAMVFYYDNFAVSRSMLEPVTTLPGWLLIVSLVAAAVSLRKRSPLFALGAVWFLVGHSLTSTVFALELMFEHRNYLPMFGLLLMAAAGLRKFASTSSSPRIAGLLGIAAIAVLALSGWSRNSTWGEPLPLALRLEESNKSSPRAAYAAGVALLRATPDGQYGTGFQEAIKRFHRAAALPGSSILPESAIIISRRGMGIPDAEAWNSLYAKLKERPYDAEAYAAIEALRICRLQGGCDFDPGRLVMAYAVLLEKEPESPDTLVSYGRFALLQAGDAALATRLFKAAYQFSNHAPAYAFPHIEMLIRAGDLSSAEAALLEAERSDRLRKFEETIAQLQRDIGSAKLAPTVPARANEASAPPVEPRG